MDQKRVIIIGGGPGGYVAAIRAAQRGAKVILIEKERIGGTCLHRGCIPTKALLADAKFLRTLRRSPVFRSLVKNDFTPLGPMMDRKQKVVHELVKGIEILLESHRVTVKHGHGDLLGPKEVIFTNRMGDQETLAADVVIIAPGSRPKRIPDLSPDGEKIITSDEALQLNKVPREIVIVGGGTIGVEFATLFDLLGSKVTIIEVLDNILPGLDGELVRHLRRVLVGDGVKICTRSTVKAIDSRQDRVRLAVQTPQGVQELMAENVMVAVGREPNLELSFAKAGVEISPKGIQVSSRMETTTSDLYAIGDATGGILLAPVASEQGIVAAENAMGIERTMESRSVPICIFTVPEIASIGLSEKEAKSREEIKVGRFPFRSNPTAVISGDTEGLVKVIASRDSDEVLGVHIIGPEASSLISLAGLLMRQGTRLKEFSDIMQAHPTLPEALKEAALDAEGMAIHLPRPLRPGVKL